VPRTLIYLEGDATMRSYEDGEGRKLNQLSLVQTKVEVLKRPAPRESETPGEAQ
jgi:single-stranded DNA-binding protein